jgi:hypothetical protein
MKSITILKKKIKLFDVILGLGFIAVVLGFFLFFHRKSENVNIRVRVTDQDVLYANTNPKTWYANRFKVGDTEMDELGNVISKITDVETFNVSSDTQVVYLDINIKAVYDNKTKLYSAKGTNLIFGNTLRFNFTNTFFNALITESPSTINQKDYSEEQRTIVVVQRSVSTGIEPEILEKIKKGDSITDLKGNVLAEVTNVLIQPALRITQTSWGSLLKKDDPYFKDAIITLDMKVKKYKGDEFVFDFIPLKLGQAVPLNFSYESILPTIIDIR